MGIFIQGQHVGYSVSRTAKTAAGGQVFSQRATFAVGAMGSSQQVVTAGTAVTGADGALERFDFLLSAPVRVVGRGTVEPGRIHVEFEQGGEVQELDVPVREPPTLSLTVASQVAGRQLHPGDVFSLPYFDPITMTNTAMEVTVEEPEVLPTGEAAFWIRSRVAGMETRRLVDGAGNTLREEAALGMSTVRMSAEEAMKLDAGEPPDIVALASVPLKGAFRDARSTRHVSLRVSGVDPTTVPSEPPLQVVSGATVTIDVPLLPELPVLPVQGEGDLERTLTIPAGHPEIVARAQAVVGDAPDRLEAVRRIGDWVYRNVAKVPTIGVPNGLEVLRSQRGDCNEHTALFVSLARAAGIPSRIAAGLVWSDRLDAAFYYHAWPEVRFDLPDGGVRWLPVDPTFGQLPADGTHLKLVTGDLDRQVEIMGSMGRIRLELVEAR
jgi:hypothetical protein